MRHKTLTTAQRVVVERLYDAFSDRDYPLCTSAVFDLGMTLGHSTFTPILMMGIDSDIHGEPSFQAATLFTVANLRLGDRKGAETAFMMNVMEGGQMRRWMVEILALSLGRMTFESVLPSARSDIQRLQAHYYESERLVTERRFDAALERFRECSRLPGECPERRFALARVSWLE